MSATISQTLLLTVALAPLLGAVVAGFFGRAIGRRGAHTVTILGVLLSFIGSVVVLKQVAVDGARHFGLVADDRDTVRAALVAAGINVLPGRFLDFRDPWGNRVEIIGYDNIQFTKAPHVLRGMGLAHLGKNEKAVRELADKGMAPG